MLQVRHFQVHGAYTPQKSDKSWHIILQMIVNAFRFLNSRTFVQSGMKQYEHRAPPDPRQTEETSAYPPVPGTGN
jgi:hypothetical protein